MKIKSIKINSYGVLKEKEIQFDSNLNIVYGKNESGKSTLLNFIKNMLYGISKNKNGKEISDFEKYTPWVGEDFSGKICYELQNKEQFEVYRNFKKKTPQILNGNFEDISKEFEIDKKEGNQFFYEQTQVDESTYLSTIMTLQQEVVLDRQTQNSLVQKVANLAGTGDDKISYQKAMEKLNKKQAEEIGNARTKDRPFNLLNQQIKQNAEALNQVTSFLKEQQNFEEKKQFIKQNEEKEKQKLEMLTELKTILQQNEMETQKNEYQIQLKQETEEKLKEFAFQKKKLLQENHLESERNNKKTMPKLFIFIFAIFIVITVFSFIFIQSKVIHFVFLSLLLIAVIAEAVYHLKAKQQQKKKQEKEKNKQQEALASMNSKIELLEHNLQKQTEEIEKQKQQQNEKRSASIEAIQKKYPSITERYFYETKNTSQIEQEMKKINQALTNYQLEQNNLLHEEKATQEKKNQYIALKEEQETLQQQKQEMEKVNQCYEITKQLLEKAYEKMKHNVTPKFTKELSHIISVISNGKYTQMTIDDEKGLMVQKEDGEAVSASSLSLGTIDELYLSLRLSMLDEISKENMPIILDEAFAYFDEERLANLLKFLTQNAKEHQVIILTCTSREQNLLTQMKIPYHLVNLG